MEGSVIEGEPRQKKGGQTKRRKLNRDKVTLEQIGRKEVLKRWTGEEVE